MKAIVVTPTEIKQLGNCACGHSPEIEEKDDIKDHG